MQTKLVIFDYDGVILDSFGQIIDIYEEIAKEFKVPKPKGREYYKANDFFELDWRITLRKWNIINKEDVEKTLNIFNYYSEKWKDRAKPFTGIDNVLSFLSKKYSLAIVSNNSKENIRNSLKRYDLEQYFSLVLGYEDGKAKPSSDLLVKCMHRLAARPEETVYIGDMDGDITAAKKAGLKRIIAALYGWHPAHRLKLADSFIENPNEIIEAVR